jgi:predicted phage terminase large subunit-like protein
MGGGLSTDPPDVRPVGQAKPLPADHKPQDAQRAPYVARALAQRQAHIRQARRDINAFVEYAFDTPSKRPVAQGWIHRQWQALMSRHQRLMIVAPRGHGKTTQMSARAMWELGNDPDHIIKLLCQSNAKAIKRLSAIRAHMKGNDRVHAVFPHLSIDRALEWNKTQVTLPRQLRSTEPSLEAIGITSSASGDRATLLIADDVVDRRNAITLPRVREAIRAAWDDWVNLLIDGRIVYICTLWHNADLTHDLLENPEWAVAWYEISSEFGCMVKLPDGQKYEGAHPLWGIETRCPQHGSAQHRAARGTCGCGPWTRAKLEQRRRELGENQFARGFSNRPMAEGELRVDPSWIHYWEAAPSDQWMRFVGIDLASSQGTDSDWTGVCVNAVDPSTGHQAVLEAHHHKLRFPDKIQLVKDLYREHQPEGFVIELAAGGRELAEYLVTKTSIPVLGVRPKAGAGKAARLDRITPLLQQGQILFNPTLHPESGLVNDRVGNLVKELLNFPVAAHEDIMDAFVHVANYCSLAHPGVGLDDDDDDWHEDDDEYDEVEDAYSVVSLY